MMYSPLIYFSEERARTRSPTGPGPGRHCRYVILPAMRAPRPATRRCRARRTAESTGVYRRPVQNRAGGHRVGVKPYASDRRQRLRPRRQQQPAVGPASWEEPAELPAPDRPRVVPVERPATEPPERRASERSAVVEAAAEAHPTAPPAATITAARAPAAARRSGRQLAVISSDRTL